MINEAISKSTALDKKKEEAKDFWKYIVDGREQVED